MTTIGQLVSSLYEKYERRYRDPELAAIATQLKLQQLLRDRVRR